MPRFLPIGKEAKGAAGFLLAALPALGALLTALAISGDLIGRMARNHPLASFGAFGSAAAAVFLGAVADYGLRAGSREERGVLAVGIVVLGGALVFGVYAGIATWGDRAQPSITVTPKSGSLVAVSVHGIGLRSSDHIVVEVEQLLRGSDRRGRPTWQPGQPLYGASLGPNGSGEIEHTVNLSLPAGDFDDLGARAQEWLEGEGIDESARRISYVTDMRYHRQGYEIPVAIDPDEVRTNGLADLEERFNALHEQLYGFRMPGTASEIVNLRAVGFGAVPLPELRTGTMSSPDASGAVVDEHDVVFDGERVRTKIYDRAKLEPGAAITGPAIVTEFDSTTVVLPGHEATVDTNYNILITPSA